MQKVTSIILSSVLVLIGVIVLLLCIFVLPWAAQETVLIHPEVAFLRYPILLGMYASALPFFYAIYETVKIIQVTRRESIFSSQIVEGLNYIKYCAFIIIGLYVLGISMLYYANALPPLVTVVGFGIMIVTIMVAALAAFIKNVLIKNQLQLSN
jgi:hypothetical protein